MKAGDDRAAVVRGGGTSTALAIREEDTELRLLRDALADIEILIYEAWEFDDRLTKDAARRFLGIAAICGWDMPWVAGMSEWVGP